MDPAPSLETYMARFFPWLDFDYIEDTEAIGGEVVVHTLSVQLNNIAESFMMLEEYYAHGAPEHEPPQDEYESPDEDELETTYIDRAIMRDPFK